MGMFDTIAWSDSVPTTPEMDELGLNKRDWEFQTKDLECLMDLYFVQGGKLYINKHRRTEFIEGDPQAKSLLDRLGHIEHYEPYQEFVAKTATIRMCDYRQSVQDAWDCWVEYEVVFKDGIVDSVKLLEFRKESDAARKEQDRKWMEKMKYENSLWINRYLFHTRPYLKCSAFLRRRLYRLAEFIYIIANKL